jgi:hypothetical protein
MAKVDRNEEALKALKQLAAELDVPAITPGQIHSTLRALVREAIDVRQQLSKGFDGGTF